MSPSHGRPFVRTATVLLVVALTLTGGSLLGASSHLPTVLTQFPVDHRTAAASLPADDAHAQVAVAGQTLKTLVLFNNTLFPGNDAQFIDGQNPLGIAYDSKDGTVWVTAADSNSVAIVNVTASIGERWLSAGYYPEGVAYDNRSNLMYVAEFASDNATVFNATTLAVVAHITLKSEPMGVAYDWRTNEVYFSDYGSDAVSIVDAATQKVVWNVSTGTYPQELTYDPVADDVLVTVEDGNALLFINETTWGVDANLTVPGPRTVAYDTANNTVYVGDANGVDLVNASNRALVGTVPSSDTAIAFALDPTVGSKGTVYAVSSGGGVQVIKGSSNTVSSTLNLGTYAYPEASVYDPASKTVLVANFNEMGYESSNLTEIAPATNTTVGSVALQQIPIDAAYSPLHHAVYVYDGGSGLVYQISDTTDLVTRSVFVGYSPETIGCPGPVVCQGIAYDPQDDSIYVDYYNSLLYGLSVVNATTFTASTIISRTSGANPESGIAIDTVDHRAFVANYESSNVSVIDTTTNTVAANITVGSHPLGLVYDPDNDRIYVSSYYDSNVSVIDGATDAVVANVYVGGMPAEEAYDPDNGDVYVVNDGVTNNLTAISATTSTTVANISLHATGTPWGIAYDPTNETIEVTMSGTTTIPGNVSVVNATNQTFVGMVAVGTTSGAGGIVYDPSVGESFVTGYTPGTVSVIALGASGPKTYNVTFDETGLAAGKEWNVTLAGTKVGSFTSTIVFVKSPGTYLFGVGSVPRYVANTTSGSVTVSSGPKTVDIGFNGTLTVSLAAAPGTFHQDSFTTITATAAGGFGPYKYVYTFDPTGCVGPNASSWRCTPTGTGTFNLTVTVTDADHNSAVNNTTVVVQPAVGGGGNSPSTGTPVWEWSILVVVALAIALMVVALLFRRKRKRPASSESEPAGPTAGGSAPPTEPS